MIHMQTFYSQMQSSDQSISERFNQLLQISQSSLKNILIVRSELAWENWPAE